MAIPINDLIQHLKSSKPYGTNEALKLYEALRSVSDKLVEHDNKIKSLGGNGVMISNSPVQSQGGGIAPRIGSVDQLIINPIANLNYDPGYYGCFSARDYITIFDQISGRQMLGFFIDKSTPNRHRILSTRFGTSFDLLPISIEIGDQQIDPALYISIDSRIAIGHINPTVKLDILGDILASGNLFLKSDTDFLGAFLHSITADRIWTFQDITGTIYQTDGIDVKIADGGTNLSTVPSNGQLLIGNGVGYTLALLLGTTNQIIVSNAAGSVTLSLPQNIDTAAVIQFLRLGLGTTPDATASLKTSGKIWCGTEIEIDSDLNHDGSNIGFYGVSPVPRPAAYTQTFSTTTRTHTARTADIITDSTGGTATTTIGATPIIYDQTYFADALASLTKELNDLRADQQNTASVLNQVVDDLQSNGVLQ